MNRAWVVYCLGWLVLCVPRTALGQAEPADLALANDLFQRGRKALLAEQYAEACDLFAESQRVDPAGGTLLNLALCHEKLGRTATAWTEFHDALSMARRESRGDRVDFALEHIAGLEGRLARLSIEPEATVTNLVIERDGSALSPGVWGKPMPVDPGSHVVEAHAPGFERFATTVEVGEALIQTVKVPALTALPVPPPARADTPDLRVSDLPAQPVAIPSSATVVEHHESHAKGRRPQRWMRPLSWSLLALSATSAVAAIATGVRAIRLYDEAESRCEEKKYCTRSALALEDESTRHAHASTTLTVLSAVSGGVGLVVWFLDKRNGDASRTSQVGVQVQGPSLRWVQRF